MLEMANPVATDRCLDLGAGAGFLTTALVDRAASVHAVDISPKMLLALRAKVPPTGAVLTTAAADMARLELPSASFDLIVSNYAMHYLTDADKKKLVHDIRDWLVPGGRVVIGDMMVGRKLDRYHRGVFREKAFAMFRQGLPGWWRLAKNVARIASGTGRLRPCPPEWWVAVLDGAGFSDVRYEHIRSEAGVVVGRA
ncbi:putative methyltransferase [mine drainage metagenome]|uniref:Putative methyltransferase n=1 Tax=mine drainage metagenome TaxID=410659 RepID=A0A1J5QSR6_9ZZZZ